MKTILAATDFSKTGDNACIYLAGLSNFLKLKITLLNVYQIPVIASEANVITPIAPEDLQKQSELKLKKTKRKINTLYPNLSVTTISKLGFVRDELQEMIKTGNYSLVGLGIKGGGAINRFLGTTSIAIAKNTTIPVLIIPDKLKFTPLTKIVFAFDRHEINDTKHIDVLIDLAKKFDSKIYVVSIVMGPDRKMSIQTQLSKMQVNDILEDTDHVFSFPKGIDIVNGIDGYLKKHKGDFLVMIRRKHGFFETIFKESNTKKMAFKTKIPLLVIND